MVIRHGESFTMCDHLTVWGADGATPEYRPTVHYAYHPSDVAINSVLELRMRNWEIQPNWRILNDEIVSGRDELGVLLMGHDLHGLVDRFAALDRRSPGDRAVTERDHPPGGRFDPRRDHLDDRQPVGGAPRARRAAVGAGAQGGQAVPRHVPLRAQRLGPPRARGTTCSPVGPGESDGLDHDDPWQFTNFLVR